MGRDHTSLNLVVCGLLDSPVAILMSEPDVSIFFHLALSSSEEVFQFVIDGQVDGALVDVHGLKHHINSLTQHNIQVNW